MDRDDFRVYLGARGEAAIHCNSKEILLKLLSDDPEAVQHRKRISGNLNSEIGLMGGEKNDC